MKQDAVVVFDDTLGDTAEKGGTYFGMKYTSLDFTELLSTAAQITFQVVADRLAGSSDTPLTLALEHSANGYDWKPKNSAPELSGTLPGNNKAASLAGGERWPARPSLRFVRVRIEAGDRKTPFAVHLKVYVTSRMRGARRASVHPDLDLLVERLPRAELLFGVRGDVLNELEQHMISAGHLAGESRSSEVIRGMSERSEREVVGLVRRVQRMDVGSKRLLLGVSRSLVAMLSADLEAHDGTGEETTGSPHLDAGAADMEVAPFAERENEARDVSDEGERRPEDAG